MPKFLKVTSLLLVLFASAFSVVSVSTNYFDIVQTSTLKCRPQTNGNPYGDALTYTISGIKNASDSQNIKIGCPVQLSSAESSSYDITAVVVGTKNNSSGAVSCELNEIENLDQVRVQVLTLSEMMNGTQPISLLWERVTKQAPETNSTFTVTCNLPPKSVLTNVAVREYK